MHMRLAASKNPCRTILHSFINHIKAISVFGKPLVVGVVLAHAVSSTNLLSSLFFFLSLSPNKVTVFSRKLEKPKFTASSFSPFSSEITGAFLGEVTALPYE